MANINLSIYTPTGLLCTFPTPAIRGGGPAARRGGGAQFRRCADGGARHDKHTCIVLVCKCMCTHT